MTRDRPHSSKPTGFSTGALERGDYRRALEWIRHSESDAVEISALRLDELEPTVRDLERLDLSGFRYISFHAPSSFDESQEEDVLRWLTPVRERGWNIVVHPDVIYTTSRWEIFGEQLLIENMDRRKRTGRTVEELGSLFEKLPQARFCLDLAHARQLDTTLTLLAGLFHRFAARIAEIHISELDSRCRHLAMSQWAVMDYQTLPWQRISGVPVIIESMLDQGDCKTREDELRFAIMATRARASSGKTSRMSMHAELARLSDGSGNRLGTAGSDSVREDLADRDREGKEDGP